MAAYEYLAGEGTEDVKGDVIRPAQRVTAQAVESGIIYTLTFIADANFTPEFVASQLDYWAGIWDDNAKLPGVAAIGTSQDVNELGQLKDIALIVVTSTSGKSSIQITLPPREWLPDRFPYWINLWRGNLDRQEAGG